MRIFASFLKKGILEKGYLNVRPTLVWYGKLPSITIPAETGYNEVTLLSAIYSPELVKAYDYIIAQVQNKTFTPGLIDWITYETMGFVKRRNEQKF